MRLAVTAATAGVLAFAAIGFATAAEAAPTGTSSAADTVKSLEAKGYNVQINGAANGPLSECSVTGVHPDVVGHASEFTTVYVNIACSSTG